MEAEQEQQEEEQEGEEEEEEEEKAWKRMRLDVPEGSELHRQQLPSPRPQPGQTRQVGIEVLQPRTLSEQSTHRRST